MAPHDERWDKGKAQTWLDRIQGALGCKHLVLLGRRVKAAWRCEPNDKSSLTAVQRHSVGGRDTETIPVKQWKRVRTRKVVGGRGAA